MSHTPHDLHETFPEHEALMRTLKTSDAHFQTLSARYEKVNEAVHRAETNLEPTDDFHEEALRKERLQILDELSAYLRAKAAGA